ncbi:MAG: murein hydrolase activator EnvC family protein [Faecalibacterium sp.]
MKRVLLWLVGVVLGTAVLLAAVMGVSYAFTTEGSRPAGAAQFGAAELEENGSCWQIPLLGGLLDKVFFCPETLTVQKLGVLTDAHPALTLPEWATYAVLSIQSAAGDTVFEGAPTAYEDFLFPANGEYKAQLTVWRVPQGSTILQFEGGSTGDLRRNLGLERPAKPTGWTRYSFRFTLQASAGIELSAERIDQGGIVGLRITGMTGDSAPIVETDLGSVQCVRCSGGWRAYIPAAYNASAGAHEIRITVNGETQTRTITVIPRDFGTVETEAEPAASEAASAEFRNLIWPLYEQAAREKLWSGGFICPAENYMTLVDFGQVKVVDGQTGSRSNSTKLYTIPGAPARAPANGVVVLARNLALTGNTVVIDHGCGVRSYLYGLQAIAVSQGQAVEKGQAVGTLGEDLTMDFKLGSKSVNPWLLFQTSGGLFWKETL